MVLNQISEFGGGSVRLEINLVRDIVLNYVLAESRLTGIYALLDSVCSKLILDSHPSASWLLNSLVAEL